VNVKKVLVVLFDYTTLLISQKGVMTSWCDLRDVKLPYACMKWKWLQLLAIYDSI